MMLKISITLLLLSTAASAADQRKCMFERQTSPEGTFAVSLPIALSTQGSRAIVAVQTTGRKYSAREMRGTNGAAEYAFSTEVSREIITIGPQGEAFWQINFTDGRTQMHYAGKCAAQTG